MIILELLQQKLGCFLGRAHRIGQIKVSSTGQHRLHHGELPNTVRQRGDLVLLGDINIDPRILQQEIDQGKVVGHAGHEEGGFSAANLLIHADSWLGEEEFDHRDVLAGARGVEGGVAIGGVSAIHVKVRLGFQEGLHLGEFAQKHRVVE